MSFWNKVVTVLMVLMLALSSIALTACEQEGPAEKAGKKIDQTVEDAGDALEDAGDKIEDATDQ